MSFEFFMQGMTDTELATALDYIAERIGSELAQLLMQEAARRLRNDPYPEVAKPPDGPDMPPLKAYAEPPDPNATPMGLIINSIAWKAIEALIAERAAHPPPAPSSQGGFLILPAGLLDEDL